jgi:O-antigen/teichoic acid export membrane protein
VSVSDLIADEAVPAAGTSHRVARNSVLYFVSLGVPALAAVFFLPVTVRALGPARFGLLALAWAIAESTGIFDFGLGKATIRFVADATARTRQRLNDVVVASLLTQAAMGTLAGIVFFLIAPLLVRRVFTIAPENQAEALAMFRVLSLHMPVLLFVASLRASLEGAQRFDVSTPLRVPGSVASVVVPAWAAFAGYSLTAILWMLLAVRVVLAVVTAYAVRQTLVKRWSAPSHFGILREMLGYSGWVAISTAIGPILGSFDRFTVGSVVGGAGLGYYGGAAEGANRFLLVPVTAFSAVFPALAAVDATEGRERTLAVTRAARRQLAALMFPLCLTLFVFGPALLGLWLGPAFSQAAGTAFRIISVGIFLAGLAILPLALLYGSGRADLPAKINLLQVALHVPITIVAVKTLGITGAGVAVAILRLEDLVFYEWATRRYVGSPTPDAEGAKRERALLFCAIALLLAFLSAVWAQTVSVIAALIVAVLGLAGYGWFAWRRVLAPRERIAWTSMLTR